MGRITSPLLHLALLAGVLLPVSGAAAPRDRQKPSVTITAPTGGTTVAGVVAIGGSARDNVAVARVSVSVDGRAFVLASGTTSWLLSWDSSTIADGVHTIAAKATDSAGLSSQVATISVTVQNVVPVPPAPSPVPSPSTTGAAGTIPFGLPYRFLVGLYEENSGTWMRDSGVKWDARYRYFTYGWANNWGWSAYDGSWGLAYLNESGSQGFTPTVQYYVMNGLSNYDESKFLATAQNAGAMAEYFNEWKLLMQRVKDFGKPAVILVEADGFGFLEQQSGNNPNAYAAVAATGIPELADLPNTVAGWGMAFLRLRQSVGASNAILTMDISGWGTGKDLLYFSLTDSLGPEVDKAYAFLAPLGLVANQTGETWDLLSNNPLDRDSDYYSTMGQNRWWDASDSASISSASFNRYAEWLRLWNAKSAKRWILWQVPIGNSNQQDVYNNGRPSEGYKDNRPEYFFEINPEAHRQKFAEDGVIGVLFGPGAGGMSFYTNDQYSDGQLFLKSRGGWFLNNGGLPIN